MAPRLPRGSGALNVLCRNEDSGMRCIVVVRDTGRGLIVIPVISCFTVLTMAKKAKQSKKSELLDELRKLNVKYGIQFLRAYTTVDLV